MGGEREQEMYLVAPATEGFIPQVLDDTTKDFCTLVRLMLRGCAAFARMNSGAAAVEQEQSNVACIDCKCNSGKRKTFLE